LWTIGASVRPDDDGSVLILPTLLDRARRSCRMG
jgi:hypothetical protein